MSNQAQRITSEDLEKEAKAEIPSLTRDEFRARILLHEASGIGSVRLNGLSRRFSSARAILKASARAQRGVPGIGDKTVHTLQKLGTMARDPDCKKKELDLAASRGYVLLMIGDPAYPDALSQIHDGPPFLWTTGDLSSCQRPAVAVVGTRRPSPEARDMAYNVGFSLARFGYMVVSGLAYGIDAEAHRGALDAGGLTMAILGSGLQRVYPSVHTDLARRISENGAVVSEFGLFENPHPGHFPRRNRIISGLSMAVVVVEAYEKGGALITARLALDQNKDVYAFPGAPGNAAATGTNRLIQSGEAQLVLNPDDVLSEIRRSDHRTNSAPVAVRLDEEADWIEPNPSDADPAVSELLCKLSEHPAHVDELCQNSAHNSSRVLVALLRLESRGIVRRVPGGYYALARGFLGSKNQHGSTEIVGITR